MLFLVALGEERCELCMGRILWGGGRRRHGRLGGCGLRRDVRHGSLSSTTREWDLSVVVVVVVVECSWQLQMTTQSDDVDEVDDVPRSNI